VVGFPSAYFNRNLYSAQGQAAIRTATRTVQHGKEIRYKIKHQQIQEGKQLFKNNVDHVSLIELPIYTSTDKINSSFLVIAQQRDLDQDKNKIQKRRNV